MPIYKAFLKKKKKDVNVSRSVDGLDGKSNTSNYISSISDDSIRTDKNLEANI